jgi:hypothetical protein
MDSIHETGAMEQLRIIRFSVSRLPDIAPKNKKYGPISGHPEFFVAGQRHKPQLERDHGSPGDRRNTQCLYLVL